MKSKLKFQTWDPQSGLIFWFLFIIPWLEMLLVAINSPIPVPPNFACMYHCLLHIVWLCHMVMHYWLGAILQNLIKKAFSNTQDFWWNFVLVTKSFNRICCINYRATEQFSLLNVVPNTMVVLCSKLSQEIFSHSLQFSHDEISNCLQLNILSQPLSSTILVSTYIIQPISAIVEIFF